VSSVLPTPAGPLRRKAGILEVDNPPSNTESGKLIINPLSSRNFLRGTFWGWDPEAPPMSLLKLFLPDMFIMNIYDERIYNVYYDRGATMP